MIASTLPMLLGLWISGAAQAAPVKGKGEASASEGKSPSVTKARARALQRARRAALQAALGQVSGKVDAQARKAVLESSEAWTGAYRILSETSDGQKVAIEVEVEIDLVRLTKRVQAKGGDAGQPAFRLGDVVVEPSCGANDVVIERVRTELGASGAVALEGSSPSLSVSLGCAALGPVMHTHLHAARVVVTATAEGEAVLERTLPAFGATPDEAVSAGVGQALLDTAERLEQRRKGHVRVRVRAPMPSARIRRLETAMRNSVLGVDEVDVAAIERGVVELRVRGKLGAKVLASRLEELSLPGFSLTVVDVDPPDVLTIRLE